jgi:glycerophosphoryl diester phosphodiesterase
VSGRPLLVAHRAGNDAARARAAAAAGADLVEADVHMRRGRLELRHPRRLGPLLWDREGLALPRRPGRDLEPALAALGPGVEPLLDLKTGPPRLAEGALAAARAALGDRPVTIASRRWRLLERLRGAPGVRLVHSAASARELARLLRMPAAARLDGAAVRADLLAPGVAGKLREGVPVLMTWPVGDAREAERLVRDGASALIVDDLALIAELAGRPLSSAGDRLPPG